MKQHSHSSQMSIGKLLLMAGLHFLLMYALMYSMVDRFENVVPNLNQVYMAAVMTAPMLLLEGWLMGGMYTDKRALLTVMAVSALVFVAAFVGIRQQTAIGDAEFLRSMIPHHAGAVLMCEQAPIEDPEIVALCEGIIAGQQAEIEQMKAILERLAGR
jgi:uncharacterized protein (DUF305 family)